ncbi:hypothetical protein RJD24_15890 [Bacillaceae bacterium IKA-2]|nr:hypothetical protein RJD24_15890 [Bacillaceae bacterium IKA-2]
MELASSKKELIITGISLLLLVAIIGSYFFFFPPLNQKIVQAEAQLQFEEELLELVQSQQIQETADISSYELQTLQKQVPVKPLVDQFILDLEKAEIYSDSFIINYDFAEGQYSGTGISTNDNNEETEVENSEDLTDTSNSDRITVSMSVVTPGYENLIQFLERIEELERITKIDQLSFTGYPEVTMVEQTADDITFSITVSTFYLPELAEFSEFAPQVDYPVQGNRNDPLYYHVKEETTNENE